MKEEHPEKRDDFLSDELIGASVGPSTEPRRDCPFCPTIFCDVPQMQKHIAFHLERLALVALPPEDDSFDDGECSVQSGDSRQPLMGGRQRSLERDFVPERGLFVYPINTSEPNCILDVCQISCQVLSIGSWDRLKNDTEDLIVFYSKTNSTMIYYLSTDKAEYKIEYDLGTVQDIFIDPYSLILSLTRGPKFLARGKAKSESFHECCDFTENLQASSSLKHYFYGNEKHFPIQIERFRLFWSFIYRDQVPPTSELQGKDQPALYRQTESISNILEERYSSEDKINVDWWLVGCIDDRLGIDRELQASSMRMLSTEPDYGRGIGNPDTWLDSKEFSLAEQVSSSRYASQTKELVAQSEVSILPSQKVPKDLLLSKLEDGISPVCAFCHSPGMFRCQCEHRYQLHEMNQAEQKIFEPIKLSTRNWVRGCAEKYVLKEFRSRVEDIKPGENTMSHRQDDIDRDEELREESNRVWGECFQHHANLMEYFFAIVDIGLPKDDEDVVRNPHFAWAMPDGHARAETELEVSESG